MKKFLTGLILIGSITAHSAVTEVGIIKMFKDKTKVSKEGCAHSLIKNGIGYHSCTVKAEDLSSSFAVVEFKNDRRFFKSGDCTLEFIRRNKDVFIVVMGKGNTKEGAKDCLDSAEYNKELYSSSTFQAVRKR